MSERTGAFDLATPGFDSRGQPTRVRLVVALDGETVVRVIPHIGYLHSGFEKLGEYRHYNQIIPLTDRTDYLSPMANNVGVAMAAEKLMGIEITPRVGGMTADIPDGFVEQLRESTRTYPKTRDESDHGRTRNAVWAGRTQSG